MTENNQPKKLNKIWLITLVIVLLGSVSALAFYLIDGSSAKDKYLLAELNTFKNIEAYLEDKYEEEITWAKQTKQHPIAQEFELSADYNPAELLGDPFGLSELINHALINLKLETDFDQEVANGLININLAGIVLDDVFVELNNKELRMNSPLFKDTLFIGTKDLAEKINENEVGKKLEDASFSELLNRETVLSEDNRSYLVKEYSQFIYKELNEDMFTSTSEKLKINDRDLRTEKISLQLSEDELKQFVLNLIEHLQSDDKALEILSSINLDLDKQEISQVLTNLKENLSKTDLKDGFKSDVWIHKDFIVARNLQFNLDETEVEVIAKQGIAKDLTFNYKVLSKEADSQVEIVLSALLEKGDEVSDEVSLELIDQDDSHFSLIYRADESTHKEETEFERTLSLDLGESLMFNGSIHWDGVSLYEADQMTSEHEVYLEIEGFNRDLFTLYIDQDAKRIKELTPFKEKGSKKDLSSLTQEELSAYLGDLF